MQASSTGDSVLRYAVWTSPSGLFHPELYFTDYDRNVIFIVFDRLVVVDKNQGFLPSLAKDYKFSDDQKTITFTLNKGVKWHDGKPLTAEDVAFTYESTASKDWPNDTPEFATKLEGYEAFHNGQAEHVSGIKVVDEQTVSFTFKEIYGGALAYFADRPVLAKHVWASTPIAQWSNATELLKNPVGTGPYKISKFVPDQYVELESNPDYFKGSPAIKKFIFKVSNRETAQSELINGGLDIAELSSFNNADLQVYKDAGARIIEHVGATGQYMTLDSTDNRLSDVRVRQALIYAIDRQAIVDKLLFGHGTIFNTIIHPDDPSYPQDLNPYKYDPNKAKELLAEAGWKDTDGDGVLDKDGQKFVLELNYPTGNKTREQSAPIIQQYLRQVGIEVQLNLADFSSTLAILQDPKKEFDATLMGGTFRVDAYETNYWWERYKNEKLDALNDQGSKTLDKNERSKVYQEWGRLHNELAIRMWLYIPNIGYAVGPKVTNYTPYPYEPFGGIEKWTVQ
ncbi:ABC transporter substrate-binding protein [Paenibacillus sp. CN-4]|uniref:ABC transporter substrate-binding protein n=1 Tax=Paenibacillus nanchangensis TaxID=3348343 RepID=UPI0039792758